MLLLVGLDTCIGEIHLLGGFPIRLEDLHQTLDQIGIAEADAELAAFVEALGIDVERAQESTVLVGQDQLRMEVDTMELVDMDPEILEQPESRDPLEDVEVPEGMDRQRRGVDLHIPFHLGADERLDDRRVDILLMLDVERLVGPIDEVDHLLTRASDAPDEVGDCWRDEVLAVPVGLEAARHLADLLGIVGHQTIVAGQSEVLRSPVQRHNEGLLAIHDHRLLMSDRVLRIRLLDVHLRVLEELEGLVIVMLPGEARGVQHHPDLHAALVGRDDRLDQDRISELEHLDVQRVLGSLEGAKDRGDPVIRLDDQAVNRVLEHGLDFI